MINYYNEFINRYHYLENYYECISILIAINSYFHSDEIIMKAIGDLPAVNSGKDDINIVIRYNEKTIYSSTNANIIPLANTAMWYKIPIEQAFHNDWFGEMSIENYFKVLSNNDVDEIEARANKPKPKLVGLNIDISKESIVFEIITTKNDDGK